MSPSDNSTGQQTGPHSLKEVALNLGPALAAIDQSDSVEENAEAASASAANTSMSRDAAQDQRNKIALGKSLYILSGQIKIYSDSINKCITLLHPDLKEEVLEKLHGFHLTLRHLCQEVGRCTCGEEKEEYDSCAICRKQKKTRAARNWAVTSTHTNNMHLDPHEQIKKRQYLYKEQQQKARRFLYKAENNTRPPNTIMSKDLNGNMPLSFMLLLVMSYFWRLAG